MHHAASQLQNLEYLHFKVVWPNSDSLHKNHPVLLFTSEILAYSGAIKYVQIIPQNIFLLYLREN